MSPDRGALAYGRSIHAAPAGCPASSVAHRSATCPGPGGVAQPVPVYPRRGRRRLVGRTGDPMPVALVYPRGAPRRARQDRAVLRCRSRRAHAAAGRSGGARSSGPSGLGFGSSTCRRAWRAAGAASRTPTRATVSARRSRRAASVCGRRASSCAREGPVFRRMSRMSTPKKPAAGVAASSVPQQEPRPVPSGAERLAHRRPRAPVPLPSSSSLRSGRAATRCPRRRPAGADGQSRDRGPAGGHSAPGRSRRGQVHPVQGDGPDPRRTAHGVRRPPAGGLHRRVERPRAPAIPYNIYAIPTQIFFDGNGKELTRHEGFISKADILATWKRFGYDFSAPGAPAPKS